VAGRCAGYGTILELGLLMNFPMWNRLFWNKKRARRPQPKLQSSSLNGTP